MDGWRDGWINAKNYAYTLLFDAFGDVHHTYNVIQYIDAYLSYSNILNNPQSYDLSYCQLIVSLSLSLIKLHLVSTNHILSISVLHYILYYTHHQSSADISPALPAACTRNLI